MHQLLRFPAVRQLPMDGCAQTILVSTNGGRKLIQYNHGGSLPSTMGQRTKRQTHVIRQCIYSQSQPEMHNQIINCICKMNYDIIIFPLFWTFKQKRFLQSNDIILTTFLHHVTVTVSVCQYCHCVSATATIEILVRNIYPNKSFVLTFVFMFACV